MPNQFDTFNYNHSTSPYKGGEMEAVKKAFSDLQNENTTLKAICVDFHWMARRYADGRQSYATSMFNDHTKYLLEIGVELDSKADGTIWARDAQGRAYDGLTEEQASEGKVHYDKINLEIEYWRNKCKQLEKIIEENK